MSSNCGHVFEARHVLKVWTGVEDTLEPVGTHATAVEERVAETPNSW